jgi:hypothetical protein
MVPGGLMLAVLAVLGFVWPRLLAWPLAAFSLWLGLALLAHAARRRSAALPGDAGGSPSVDQAEPTGSGAPLRTQDNTEAAP